MRPSSLVVLAAALALAACGTTPTERATTGAGIGAATGAVAGAILGAPLLGAQLRTVPLDGGLRSTQCLQPLPLGGDGEFRVAEPRAQHIALFELVAETVREICDARAHGGEFGLGKLRVCGFGRRPSAGAIQDPREGCA